MVGTAAGTVGANRMNAASTWTGHVTAPAGVDLRTRPHATAPVIRTIVHGDTLRVHGCLCGHGSDWYAVTYDGQQDGYVVADGISEGGNNG